jgi:hypothetical protein
MLGVVEHAIAIAPRLKITDSIAADRMTITSASSGKHQVISAAMKATSSLHVILAGAGDHHHHQQR